MKRQQIPNILSALRIVMVGGFVGMFVTGQYLTALFVYLLAFFTDILDGWLARTHGWVTDLGKLLDPLADKLMTLCVLCCIAVKSGHRPMIVLLLLAAVKELLLFAGGILLLHRNRVVCADWAGKIAAGLYGAGIVLLLAGFSHTLLFSPGMKMLIAATAVSYAALVHYAAVFLTRKETKMPVPSD